MTATPLMMPRRKAEAISAVEVVYTTNTGDAPRRDTQHAPAPAVDSYATYDPYCFVCRRCTDHVGEHEALVEAGLAAYTGGGVVSRTKKWDADLAAAISEAEFQTYQAALNDGTL